MTRDARPMAVTALALAGLLGAALLGPVAATAGGLAAVACLFARPLRPHVARWPWSPLTAAVLLALAPAGLLGLPAQELLAVLLAWLQVRRRLARSGEGDDRTSALLAGLMLLVAAGRVTEPALVVPIAAWWTLLPVVLSCRPVSPRTAALPVAIVAAVSAAAFLLAPRLVASRASEEELTGFSPEVELGAMDELLDDPGVVFRAWLRPAPAGPVYWRGVALDAFDGRQWSSSSAVVPVEVQGPRMLPPGSVVIDVEPVEAGRILFTTGRVVDLDVDPGPVLADGASGYRATVDPRRYQVVALPPFAPGVAGERPIEASPDVLAAATSLPVVLEPRVRALAAEVAGGGEPREQVERLAAWLAQTFVYTRRPGGRGLEAPLEAFLFDTRAGHCEYFATALAVLARARGIPARVVNGFVGGEVDPRTGEWTVRRYHAHSWTEVHLDGWVAVDATPGAAATLHPPEVPRLAALSDALRGAWRRGIVDYDRGDQAGAVLAASRGVERGLDLAPSRGVPWRGLLVLAVAGGGLASGARVVSRRLARRLLDPPPPWPEGPVDRAHERARRHLNAVGVSVPPALPPVEAARWVAERHPGPPADALVELAWLYYEVRLGGRDARAAAAEARRLAARVCEWRRGSRRAVLPEGR